MTHWRWGWIDLMMGTLLAIGCVLFVFIIAAVIWRACCTATIELQLSEWQCTTRHTELIAGKYPTQLCDNWKRK